MENNIINAIDNGMYDSYNNEMLIEIILIHWIVGTKFCPKQKMNLPFYCWNEKNCRVSYQAKY